MASEESVTEFMRVTRDAFDDEEGKRTRKKLYSVESYKL